MAETMIGPRFSVGSVLVRSFDLLFRNLFAIIALVFIIVIPVTVLGGIIFFGIVGSTMALVARPGASLIWIFAGWFFFIVVYQLMTAAIIHAVFQSLRGQPVRLGASISLGFSRIGALILVAVIFGLAVMAGFIIFVIPAIFVFLIWYVVVPVCVIERRDAVESLSRSQELTRGHRWAILGLVLIVGIGSGIGSFLLESVFGFILGTTIAVIASALWSVFTSAYSAVALTVVYHDLRVEKEGVDVEQIAKMFA